MLFFVSFVVACRCCLCGWLSLCCVCVVNWHCYICFIMCFYCVLPALFFLCVLLALIVFDLKLSSLIVLIVCSCCCFFYTHLVIVWCCVVSIFNVFMMSAPIRFPVVVCCFYVLVCGYMFLDVYVLRVCSYVSF